MFRKTEHVNRKLANTKFEEALAEFRTFLDNQGEIDPIIWTFVEDVFSRRTNTFQTDFWIKTPIPSENSDCVKAAYIYAQQKNLGLGFSAYARCSEGVCCSLIVPADLKDAEYLLIGPRSIKYSLTKFLPVAQSVRSNALWWFYKLLPTYRKGNHLLYLQSKAKFRIAVRTAAQQL